MPLYLNRNIKSKVNKSDISLLRLWILSPK